MSMVDDLKKYFDSLSEEEIEEHRRKFNEGSRNLPIGWISIEDDLPMFLAFDIEKGYTEYKVKFKDGTEGISAVSDHDMWYVIAKKEGITHWYNENN